MGNTAQHSGNKHKKRKNRNRFLSTQNLAAKGN